MLTTAWGPATWISMHHFVAGYSNHPTPQDEENMNQYLYGIANNLPCEDCQYHFKNLLQQYPPDLSSSCALTNWLYEAHNMVNARLGKPQFTIKQFQQKYADAIRAHHQRKAAGI